MQPLQVIDWCQLSSPQSMYTQAQRDAKWDNTIYVDCPLFLDWPIGECPEFEKERYNLAYRTRLQIQQEEINTIVEEVIASIPINEDSDSDEGSQETHHPTPKNQLAIVPFAPT